MGDKNTKSPTMEVIPHNFLIIPKSSSLLFRACLVSHQKQFSKGWLIICISIIILVKPKIKLFHVWCGILASSSHHFCQNGTNIVIYEGWSKIVYSPMESLNATYYISWNKWYLRDCMLVGLKVSYASIKFCKSNITFGSLLGGKLFIFKVTALFNFQFKSPQNY